MCYKWENLVSLRHILKNSGSAAMDERGVVDSFKVRENYSIPRSSAVSSSIPWPRG